LEAISHSGPRLAIVLNSSVSVTLHYLGPIVQGRRTAVDERLRKGLVRSGILATFACPDPSHLTETARLSTENLFPGIWSPISLAAHSHVRDRLTWYGVDPQCSADKSDH
jgi:hypothetical protein